MNRDEITRKTSELSTIAHTTEGSKVEYWYARELMTYMGIQRIRGMIPVYVRQEKFPKLSDHQRGHVTRHKSMIYCTTRRETPEIL